MATQDLRRRLTDIVDNIDRIRAHVRGLTFETYTADDKTRDAVERCFQRISEAAVKIGSAIDARQPQVPWRNVRALGSVLRHDYDDIHDDVIWDTIEHGLGPLRAACVAELATAAPQ